MATRLDDSVLELTNEIEESLQRSNWPTYLRKGFVVASVCTVLIFLLLRSENPLIRPFGFVGERPVHQQEKIIAVHLSALKSGVERAEKSTPFCPSANLALDLGQESLRGEKKPFELVTSKFSDCWLSQKAEPYDSVPWGSRETKNFILETFLEIDASQNPPEMGYVIRIRRKDRLMDDDN